MQNSSSKIEAVFFDWAGTFVDFGSLAPARAFVELFRRFDLPITMLEARAPMGSDKRSHIEAILAVEQVKKLWDKVYGRPVSSSDVDKMYDEFVKVQIDCLKEHSELIPGTIEMVSELKKRNCKIGSSTGYTREIMSHLIPLVEKQGFLPDSTVCASDVKKSRPYPNMLLKSMMDLEVLKTSHCVKVDDTVVGIEEGLNAGCWTVGVAISGNALGMSFDEWKAQPSEKKEELRKKAYASFQKSGAHYIVDSIADLTPCLDDIEQHLAL